MHLSSLLTALTHRFKTTRLMGLLGLTTLLATFPLAAIDINDITYQGMFGGKAKVKIDGRLKRAPIGEQVFPGVTVLAVKGKTAIIEVDQQRYRYRLGSNQPVPLQKNLTLSRNRNGMFMTGGQINGKQVNFLVDTGATLVALSSRQARALGVRYNHTRSGKVNTASGTAKAYPVTLKSVQIGDILVEKVAAMIIKGDSPAYPLLGNSFLSQVKIIQDNQQMVISQP